MDHAYLQGNKPPPASATAVLICGTVLVRLPEGTAKMPSTCRQKARQASACSTLAAPSHPLQMPPLLGGSSAQTT